jgi:hypothetical protein
MTAEALFLWVSFISSLILVGAYSWTLYKVRQGKIFAVIVCISVLILLSNLLFICWSLGSLQVSKGRTEYEKGSLICLSIGNFCFNASHWVLAWYYYRTAVNIPEVLEADQREKEPELKKANHGVLWTGIVVFALTSIGLYWALTSLQSEATKTIYRIFDALELAELLITGVVLT